MRVLVACEFSGTVREAFAQRGHDAWSCDILPTEIEGKHIQDDVLNILNQGWDLMIAHPPCTYLSIAGAQHLKCDQRKAKAREAAEFFNRLLNAPIPKIAVENPVQHGYAREFIRPYCQVLRMNQFGHNAYKPTCLWLKGLPRLTPTTDPVPVEIIKYPNGRSMSKWYANANAKKRSKTFQGFADAMADQWSKPTSEVSDE